MRKMLTTLGIAGAMATAAPVAGQAGDEGWAALGGFLGGTILGEVFHGHHGHHGHQGGHTVVVEEHHYVQPAGHYEYEKREVWHEGYYSYEYDRCGRRIRVWNPGYYTYTTVKVWVEHRGHHRDYAYCD
jgi:hypothetical protein